jgi:hypothetical protein
VSLRLAADAFGSKSANEIRYWQVAPARQEQEGCERSVDDAKRTLHRRRNLSYVKGPLLAGDLMG